MPGTKSIDATKRTWICPSSFMRHINVRRNVNPMWSKALISSIEPIILTEKLWYYTIF